MADAPEPSRISTHSELDDLMNASRRTPVWLFKHSLICPTSSAAWAQFERFAAAADPDIQTAVIEIQRARDVSQEVAARTGVRHESPQVLLIRDGEAVWSATHWAITERSLEDAAVAHCRSGSANTA